MVAKRGKKSAKKVKDLPVKTLASAREKKVKGGYRGRYQVRLQQAKDLLKP